jgi:membrane protein
MQSKSGKRGAGEKRRAFASFARNISKGYTAHNVPNLASSLAFYGALSLAPLLVFVTYLAGMVYGKRAIQGELFSRLQFYLGDNGAQLLERAVAYARTHGGHYPLLLSALVAVWGAASLFQEIRSALHQIWGVPDKEGLRGFLGRKGHAFAGVFVYGLLAVVLLGAYAFISAFSVIGGTAAVIIEEASSLIVVSGAFMLSYRLFSGAKVPWRAAAAGGTFAATLFLTGRFILTWYFARAAPVSVYAAMGSLMALLLWLYISNIAFLIGAEMARTIGEHE